MSDKNIECNNRSAISVEGSELSCKVFVYIKEDDVDVLAVNNLVAATQDANGDINVYSVEVIQARKKSGNEEEVLEGFEWTNLPVIKAALNEYLKEEMSDSPCISIKATNK